MAHDWHGSRVNTRRVFHSVGMYLHIIKSSFTQRTSTRANEILLRSIETHLRTVQTKRTHQKLIRKIEHELRFNETKNIAVAYNDYVRRRVDKIALIGAGKMGGALIQSWTNLGLSSDNLIIVDPKPSGIVRKFANEHNVPLHENVDEIGSSSVFVLAIKPQESGEVLPRLRRFVRNRTLIISIMAGKTIRGIQSNFQSGVGVVRAMPNLPAIIGRGITAAIANEIVTTEQRELAAALLSATGGVVWVAEENMMDAVTAVSGSGPAYVFLLAEYLVKAATAAGLPIELASRLAKETVAGAGELLDHSDDDPAVLRRNVTSPGGTTAAALEILMGSDGFEALLNKAVAAATKRSRELAD